jgi:RNA polymerase sigma factor (sigma-70 family)
MGEESSPYILRIQECEAAIVRIRSAIRADRSSSEQVAQDFELILAASMPSFVRYARSVRWVSPTAEEEAIETMGERLLLDIWSLTFPSLETKFGSYLTSMPIRVVQTLRRKLVLNPVSSPLERLDEPIGDEGMLRHEAVGDPRAEAGVGAIAQREALQQALAALPALEREVFLLRYDGATNNEIAQRLAVSPSTATRIYQRAVDELRRRLEAPEE